jgi:broad specificity phosphatase PhoE
MQKSAFYMQVACAGNSAKVVCRHGAFFSLAVSLFPFFFLIYSIFSIDYLQYVYYNITVKYFRLLPLFFYAVFNYFDGGELVERTKIYLIRHGESLGNAVRQLLGHTDLDLSPLGYRQADLTATALSSVQIDEVYSSDLLRAYNTALPHAKMRGLEVQGRTELRELFLGDWEGMRVEEVMQKYGEDAYQKDWREGFGVFAFPHGESVKDGCRRFTRALSEIARHSLGKTILVAAHAAVMRSFYARALGIAFEDIAAALPFPANASYSIVEFDGESFTPIAFSCDEHLRVLSES